MAKPTKSRNELVAMIMAEVRRHPECNEVASVAITKPIGLNWDISTLRDGPKIPPASWKTVQEIVTRLRSQYDLES